MDTNVTTDAGFIDDNYHESEDTGNEEVYCDEGTLETNLRQRKGKIMSCAKETIENGKSFFLTIISFSISLTYRSSGTHKIDLLRSINNLFTLPDYRFFPVLPCAGDGVKCIYMPAASSSKSKVRGECMLCNETREKIKSNGTKKKESVR
jgi:hypothetical protein